MNIADIEEATDALAKIEYDAGEFALSLFAAYDAPPATITRIRNGSQNPSDLEGGFLWKRKMHVLTCLPGEVPATLDRLAGSTATRTHKVQFVIATDGEEVAACDLVSDEARFFPRDPRARGCQRADALHHAVGAEGVSERQGYRYVVREVPDTGELDGGVVVAWAESLPRAMHYAHMYGQDGPVTLWDGEERIGRFGRRALAFEVHSDGRAVWVCDDESMNRARFGRLGFDIHETAARQIETGKVCLTCRRRRLTAADWPDWQSAVKQHLGVQVGDEHAPAWVGAKR